MQPDNELHLNQAEQTGDKAEEFGRGSVEPSPTKQDLNLYYYNLAFYSYKGRNTHLLLLCDNDHEGPYVVKTWDKSSIDSIDDIVDLLNAIKEHNGLH